MSGPDAGFTSSSRGPAAPAGFLRYLTAPGEADIILTMILRGKTALITGASKRIGRAIAFELASAGANIIIHFNHSAREAVNLACDLADAGVKAWCAAADFSPRAEGVEERVRKLVKTAYGFSRRIDVLVNNSAIYHPSRLPVKEADWDEFMTVNLKFPFFLAQEIGRRMFRAKGGVIINLADWTAGRPHKDYIPYAVSKAGLMTATQGLAKALAPSVRVNAIAPGPILPAAGHSPAHHRRAAAQALVKRYGKPEDIARTVRFLCEGTDYITGAMIPVEGGSMIA